MSSKFAAAATQPAALAAASELALRGNAVDAVCAGVLAAAAEDPSVLFGPLHVLVTGPGFGVRCIDGRLRQPGLGAPRPRGFVEKDEIPDAARVAIPALPAAVATALSMFGTVTAKRAFASALDALERKHPRRALLEALAREGPSVLAKDPFADALTTAFGRLAGGVMTADDLRAPRAPAEPCAIENGGAFAPFAEDVAHGELHAVCAADRRGGVAVACYEIAREGFAIESLGVIAPLRAEPVMRGVRRIEPGAPLPCASSVCLVATDTDQFDIAAGFTGDGATKRARELAAAVVRGTALEAALKSLGSGVGVLETDRGVRAYSLTP